MFLLGTINLQFYDDLILMLSHKQSWDSLIKKVTTSCQTGNLFFPSPLLSPSPPSPSFYFTSGLKSTAWSKGAPLPWIPAASLCPLESSPEVRDRPQFNSGLGLGLYEGTSCWREQSHCRCLGKVPWMGKKKAKKPPANK